MRRQGYRRRREGTYEKREGDLLATVSFQRSVYNTTDLVEFTINLSVLNEPIMQQYSETAKRHNEQGTPKHLLVLDGSWSCRMGELLSGFDTWWTFQSGEPTESVVGNVVGALEQTALPRIESEMDRLAKGRPSVVVIDDED